jgi:hypothetical protein
LLSNGVNLYAALAQGNTRSPVTNLNVVGLCTLNEVDPEPIAYNLSNP